VDKSYYGIIILIIF